MMEGIRIEKYIKTVNIVKTMQKVIKKWGTGLGIYIDKEDIRILDLKKGDIVDIEIYVKRRGDVRENKDMQT